MPANYVKKLAKEKGMSTAEAESKWNKAKDAAADQGHADDYGYVTAIFKKMMGESLDLPLIQSLSEEYCPELDSMLTEDMTLESFMSQMSKMKLKTRFALGKRLKRAFGIYNYLRFKDGTADKDDLIAKSARMANLPAQVLRKYIEMREDPAKYDRDYDDHAKMMRQLDREADTIYNQASTFDRL